MSQALLFDLDGTLIQSSMDVFLPSYFASLTKRVADLVAPSKFIAQLQESTRLMIANNDPARTNADVFAADFFPKIGLSSEQLMPIFDDFYTREYRDLRAYIRPIPLSRQIIARAFERRHTVVIATMPVFPLTAIQQRLQWGDLADFPYALITV